MASVRGLLNIHSLNRTSPRGTRNTCDTRTRRHMASARHQHAEEQEDPVSATAPHSTRDTAPEYHTMMVKCHSAPLACRTMMRPDACGPPHEARADARQYRHARHHPPHYRVIIETIGTHALTQPLCDDIRQREAQLSAARLTTPGDHAT